MRNVWHMWGGSRTTHYDRALFLCESYARTRFTFYVLRFAFYALRRLGSRAVRPGIAVVGVECLVEPAAPAALAPVLALGVHIHRPGAAHNVQRLGRAVVVGLHGDEHTAALDALGVEVRILLGDAHADERAELVPAETAGVQLADGAVRVRIVLEKSYNGLHWLLLSCLCAPLWAHRDCQIW